jgi:phosphatidylinositol glycan class U
MAIVKQQKLLLFGAAAAVRLLLFTVFPALPDLLAGRVEVSTPVTSFKRRMCLTCSVYTITDT